MRSEGAIPVCCKVSISDHVVRLRRLIIHTLYHISQLKFVRCDSISGN